MKRKPLLAIVGPTGVGKTALAVRLAKHFPLEVVSADSRQIYVGMDVGTAKPTPEERAAVPHHLVDIVRPDQDFSLAEFQRMAYRAISEIHARGNLPALVGGTGQYVSAVLEGWQVPEVPPNRPLRDWLGRLAEARGREWLYLALKAIDPQAAEFIDPTNLRRVVRALEVCIVSGRRFSESRKKHPPPYDILRIGLTLPRDELYRRVDARVDRMIESGWVEEVERLLAAGYSPDLPSMSALGYREIISYLQGEVSLEEAVRRIKIKTHRYIRQQYSWFSLSDPLIKWFEAREEEVPNVVSTVRAWLDRAT